MLRESPPTASERLDTDIHAGAASLPYSRRARRFDLATMSATSASLMLRPAPRESLARADAG